MATPSQQTIETLNSLLRGEISAVETYKQALEAVESPAARQKLQSCEQSHEKRVASIRQRIVQIGGEPSETGGAWTAFAKMVEGGAKTLGEKAAITALEQGEDMGLSDYRKGREALDGETRAFVEKELLPAQEMTHSALSQLKHTMN